MPFQSEKQAKLMRAAAHNPGFARKVGIDVEVAKEFVKKSEGKPMRRKAHTGGK